MYNAAKKLNRLPSVFLQPATGTKDRVNCAIRKSKVGEIGGLLLDNCQARRAKAVPVTGDSGFGIVEGKIY